MCIHVYKDIRTFVGTVVHLLARGLPLPPRLPTHHNDITHTFVLAVGAAALPGYNHSEGVWGGGSPRLRSGTVIICMSIAF